MSKDPKPHSDSPRSRKPTKTLPDDFWEQPALTPREASAHIAKMKREGRLPTFEQLQDRIMKAKKRLGVIK